MSDTTKVRFFFCGHPDTFPFYRSAEDYVHLLVQDRRVHAPIVVWNSEAGIPTGYGFCKLDDPALPRPDDLTQPASVRLLTGDVVHPKPPRSGVLTVGDFQLFVDGVGLYN